MIASFLWRRDKSLSFKRQLALAASVSLGIFALVLLEAFSSRVASSVEKDTKSLLAADYQVQAWRAFTPEIFKAADDLFGKENYIQQTDFVSSAFLKGGDRSPITVQLRALEKKYPFYGAWQTSPEGIRADDLRAAPEILAEMSLSARGWKVGDEIELGRVVFKVKGFVTEEPQSVASAFALGPRIYLHQDWLEKTGLLGTGARAFRMLLIRSPLEETAFRAAFRERVPDPHWRIVTPARANRQVGAVVEKLRAFLSFVGLSAVLLGAIGIFIAFRARMRQRLPQLLGLRCLGLKNRDLYALALREALSIAAIAFVFASTVSIALEQWISSLLSASLTLTLGAPAYGPALALAFFLSLITVLSAVFLPLREALRLPVSEALRDSESARSAPLSMSDLAGGAALILLIVLIVERNLRLSAYFLGTLLTVALVAIGAALLFFRFCEKRAAVAGFSMRHSLLAFSRHRATHLFLIASIVMGAFLPASVYLVGHLLRSEIEVTDREGMPNLFLIGVAPDDRAGLAKLLPDSGLSFVPVTQARLVQLNGEDVQEQQGDPTDAAQFYRVREYTVTRRNDLQSTERLVKGESIFGAVTPGIVRASFEEKFAERIGLKVGDRFRAQIAGVEVEAELRSTRRVDWLQLRPNFFIVFSEEDLGESPMDFVGVGRRPGSEITDAQKRVAASFPQITTLNGEAIRTRLTSLVGRLSFAVSSLSLLSVLSSLLVLAAVVFARRSDKRRELLLWRCLGVARGRLAFLLYGDLVLAGILGLGLAAVLAVGAAAILGGQIFSLSIEWGRWPFGWLSLAFVVFAGALALLARLVLGPELKKSLAKEWSESESS